MTAHTFAEGMEAFGKGPATQCVTDAALRGWLRVAMIRALPHAKVERWIGESWGQASEQLDRLDASLDFDDILAEVRSAGVPATGWPVEQMTDEPGYTEARQFPR